LDQHLSMPQRRQLLEGRSDAIRRRLAGHVANWLWAGLGGPALPVALWMLADVVTRLGLRALKHAHRLRALSGTAWTIGSEAWLAGTDHGAMWLAALHHAARKVGSPAARFALRALALGVADLLADRVRALVGALRSALCVVGGEVRNCC